MKITKKHICKTKLSPKEDNLIHIIVKSVQLILWLIRVTLTKEQTNNKKSTIIGNFIKTGCQKAL
jgi:hypothetical protein